MQGDVADRGSWLPWPSCSTAGLLALLMRFWASPTQQAGLLTDPGADLAAKATTDLLLGVFVGHGCELRLLLSVDADLRWPRPPTGRNLVRLWIDEWLAVDTDSIDFTMLPEPQDPIDLWLRDVLRAPRLTLRDLLQAAMHWRPRRAERKHNILGQLILMVAVALEERLMGSVGEPDALH